MFLIFLTLLVGFQGPSTDHAASVRRVVGIVALAAQEYGVGVRNGKVIAPAEVEEARLFLAEARRTAQLLPAESGAGAVRDLDALFAMVGRTAPPDSVTAAATRLGASLAERFQVSLDEIPGDPPSLAAGAQIYRAQCALCHGALGQGDGPGARDLTPRPADLSDVAKLASTTPLDFYRRITLGVAGTAMPGYEGSLSADQRWAVAVYATTLRYPPPTGDVPEGMRDFPTTARLTDSALAAALLPGAALGSPAVRARLAAVRAFGTTSGDSAQVGRVFASVRDQLDSVMGLMAAGRSQMASTRAFDAYLTFEGVERRLGARSPALAGALESGFAALRARAAGGATAMEMERIHTRLLSDLENAERIIADRPSRANLFAQSLILLLREGLEAILIVGAVLAFLAKTGAGRRRRDIHIGVGAAIGASLVTALGLETVFQVSSAGQEALEGGVMLLATAMLFYVSYWLLSKMEVAKWNRFVRGRVQDAVSSGSALALASVSFLAVYREGFETVLFYKALFLAGAGSAGPVVAGMLVGAGLLALVYYAIHRWGVRIPLKPFFGVTSAFLYYMAFVFAGKGVAELQEGGVVGTTVLSWAPRFPALGIYPTIESLALQAVLLVLLIAGLVWTFVLEPRRLKITNQLMPDPPGFAADRPDPPPGFRAAGVEGDMVRSLERMDADLAELRAEVERLKGLLLRSARAAGRSAKGE